MGSLIGRVLYGALFCAVLPALLVIWSVAAEGQMTWRVPTGAWGIVGWVLALCGSTLMLVAMRDLWVRGRGLPMNAYPPDKLVSGGAYGLFLHPIYVGACLTCIGTALITGSVAGLYLVSPVLVLGCWALVAGYEESAIRAHFRTGARDALFRIPPDGEGHATWPKRMAVACVVFLPWLLVYELLIHVGPAERAIDTFLPIERGRTVITWAEPIYAFTYVFVVLVPFLMPTQRALRAFALDAVWAVAIGLFLQLVIPFKAEPLPLPASEGLFARLLEFERASDGPAAAFPSFHVIWALVAAVAYGRAWPRGKVLWWGMAMAIAWSCTATGMHSLLDILGGGLVFLCVRKRMWVAERVRDRCERIANSWSEVHVGRVRAISHGIYAGAAGAVCILVSAWYGAPPWPMLLITSCGLVMAALWGQFVEGSPRLLRPFGFYGSVLGVALGATIVAATGHLSFGYSLTALALAAPWMQLVGRFRCLVQGCCHGAPTGNAHGITYTNPHTRVCAISDLRGRKIHNTQLYSIGSNLILGTLLWRLAWSGMSASLIIGVYLIMGGMGRFVEEHYRGEVQTRMMAGLRLYQWVALLSVLLGIAVTFFHAAPFEFRPIMDMSVLLASAIGGIIAALAMSVDLPRSNMRFSRLSG